MNVNDRPPNVRTEHGRLLLVRCFACDTSGRGRENWAPRVWSGVCAWCGWAAEQPDHPNNDDERPAV